VESRRRARTRGAIIAGEDAGNDHAMPSSDL
jgi:hypothetical protein